MPGPRPRRHTRPRLLRSAGTPGLVEAALALSGARVPRQDLDRALRSRAAEGGAHLSCRRSRPAARWASWHGPSPGSPTSSGCAGGQSCTPSSDTADLLSTTRTASGPWSRPRCRRDLVPEGQPGAPDASTPPVSSTWTRQKVIDMVRGNAAKTCADGVPAPTRTGSGHRGRRHRSGGVLPGRAQPAPRPRRACGRSLSCRPGRQPVSRHRATTSAERAARSPGQEERSALPHPKAAPLWSRTPRRARRSTG